MSEESFGKNSVARSEREMNLNESLDVDDKASLDGSLEELDFNRRNFSDYQDDRKIVKFAALNDKYKLVERPRWLLNFSTATWESKFATSVFRKHYQVEIFTFSLKALCDLFLVEAFIWSAFRDPDQ